ncbi:hypothetical protein AUJ64_01825 [Candidatus Pacearchaeota archaeon CG1_02_39_14]|nr:MAG: hypothetical protein AUJ64_01825 [Candidatus Pacearchaeota archaeon CG1_02_39_14]
MNKKFTLFVILILLSGLVLAQELSVTNFSPVQKDDSALIPNNSLTATAIQVPPKDSSNPFIKTPDEIIKLVDSGRINKKILVESKVIGDYEPREIKESDFIGTIKVYDGVSLIDSSTYIKGFKVEALALKLEQEIIEGSPVLLTECGPISEPGVYYLDSVVYGGETCFEIESNDVFLDCRNHPILYSMKGEGNAISSHGNSRIAIKDCGMVKFSSEFDSPAISISAGKEIFISNNAAKTNSENSGLLVLNNVKNVLVLGNSFELSGENSKAVSITQAEDITLKRNKIATSPDNAPGIFLEEVRKSTIEDNKISTSGDNSPTIYTLNTRKNDFIDNKIKTSGDSSAFLIFGGSIENDFRDNHIVESGKDAFEFSSGSLSGALQQNGNLLSENKFGAIEGYTLNLAETSSLSNITLLNQAVDTYVFHEDGIFPVIRRPIYGAIAFTEPVTGSGSNATNIVKLNTNFMQVKSDIAPGLNKPAIVIFNNLPGNMADPVILKDGLLCESPECEILSMENETAKISVSEWGSYSVGERPEEPQQLIVEEELRRRGGGCSTVWVCDSWNTCEEGQQERTCVKQNEFCYADPELKPVEAQSCTESEIIEVQDEQQGAIARITGAVIGFGRQAPGLAILIFLGLIAGLYLVVALARRRFNLKK